MAEKLGVCTCPLCGSSKARVSLSRSQLSVITCTAFNCGIQLFARSDGADERVRSLIIPEKPVEVPAAPAVEPQAAPAVVEVKTPEPEPVPPKPKRKATGTAFDALLGLGGA